MAPVLETGLAVSIDPALREALDEGRWSAAADLALTLEPSPEQAFLASWCLVEARRATEAVALLDRMDGPPNWVLTTQGAILVAAERPEEAVDALELVDLESPIGDRAGLLRAKALDGLGRTDEAREVHLSLIQREGPRVATVESLVWLAKDAGEKTPEAYPYLRRIWFEYPGGSAETWAASILRRHHRTGPTDWERARRAERLMWRWHTSDALSETRALLPNLEVGSEPWCRARYVRGRSYAMRWNAGAAVQAFGDAGEQCVDTEGDFGERIQWWSARMEGRLRHHAHATRDYAKLAELYPDSHLADDALLKAGEHSVDTGEWPEARQHWAEALELPLGDRTAEAGFRLAWAKYVDGDTPGAVDIANELAALPLERGRFDVPAARYWSARWTLDTDREAAIARWVALCEDAPWSVYAVLAWMRLSEEAPEQAARVAQRSTSLGDFSHRPMVRRTFLDESEDAIGLARVGLMAEAHKAWGSVDEATLLPAEYGWWTSLRVANGEAVDAHADARVWIRTHPWDVHDPDQRALAYQTWPRTFGEEVDVASEGRRFDPLTLQALIRTESNFDHEVRSRAGARGLAQLMPYTARRVARWDGETLDWSQMYEPSYNLGLGGRYLDYLYEQFDNNPFLAAAGYNAGEHRVEYWLKSWAVDGEAVPTDEFIERIPYPETRGYVKRVVGTWQAYELLYGDGPLYDEDLVRFTRTAQPKGIQDLLPDPDER